MTKELVKTTTIALPVETVLSADEMARSIRAAQLFQLTERRKLEQDFGFKFDPFRDGQLLRDRRKK